MRPRKTIEIKKIVERANKYFEDSPDSDIENRKAIAWFVSDILHSSGNYRGFNYLPSESDLNAGHYGKDGRVFFYK